MKKIYYLSSCDTCKRILKELDPIEGFDLQDIKTTPITFAQLEDMRKFVGSYQDLFSRRARLFKEKGLQLKQLSEDDYAALILEHYTFLKRPVIIVDDKIFIGNSKKEIALAKQAINP